MNEDKTAAERSKNKKEKTVFFILRYVLMARRKKEQWGKREKPYFLLFEWQISKKNLTIKAIFCLKMAF